MKKIAVIFISFIFLVLDVETKFFRFVMLNDEIL